MSLPDPQSSSGAKQVRLPYEAIMYLIKKLEAQGATLDDLERMNDGVVLDMMNRMGQQQAPQGQSPPPPPMI